ncbi:MAG: endoribonuclease YicC domain-containing protein, partial [Tepidimonas ignava]
TRISSSGEAFQANRAHMLGLIERMRGLEARARKASAAAGPRFHERGQLLPRERIALVLDPGAPFIELCTLSGYRMDVPDPDKSVPGSGVISGIGFVSGVRCFVSASDAGIDAGALQERALVEAAAFAQRVDVAEELTRLQSHLTEIDHLLQRGGEVGKRLDFLIQELHREANTLGSKSSSLDLTRISVDMKVLIEQMREQVQNLE